ncbi:MAG: hypothetical protein GY861_29270 [bacterium]|nr:hypothetical protein [bacterium]
MILTYKLVDGNPERASIWERDTKTEMERCIWEEGFADDNYATEYKEWQRMEDIGEDTLPELCKQPNINRISKDNAFLEMI